MNTTVHLRLRRLARTAPLAASLVLAVGCASTTPQVVLYKNGPNGVSLQSRTKDGGMAPQGYSHPAALSEGQIDRMLAAVGVEEYSFFNWRSQGPLFTDEQRAMLAPWFVNALRKATPDQWVRFSVYGSTKLLVLTTPHLSDGICFVKDGKFNLVLGNINFEFEEALNVKPMPYGLDPRDRIDFPNERLTVVGGPGVAPPPLVKGDKWFGKERSNWLQFDLAAFASGPAEIERPKVVVAPPPAAGTARPAPAPPAPVSPDAADRLKKLKDLRDQGLITAEEYDKKRHEIIQGL